MSFQSIRKSGFRGFGIKIQLAGWGAGQIINKLALAWTLPVIHGVEVCSHGGARWERVARLQLSSLREYFLQFFLAIFC